MSSAIANLPLIFLWITKCCCLPFQLIIAGSWIFAFIVSLPWFLFLEEQDNYCRNAPMYGQDWIPKAYHVFCSSLVAVFVVMMAGLYSRIVYTLWLKRVEDNHSAFQQQVSTSNNTEVLNVKESFVSALSRGLHVFPRGCSSETSERATK